MPWAPTFASGPALRSEAGGGLRRDFRGRRLVVNLMRALHLVALAGFAAAVLKRSDLAGKTGGWTDQLQVFERDGQACLRCRDVVSKVRISGRTAYMCESCQV